MVRFQGHRSGHNPRMHDGQTVTECRSRPAAPATQAAVREVEGSPRGDPKSELRHEKSPKTEVSHACVLCRDSCRYVSAQEKDEKGIHENARNGHPWRGGVPWTVTAATGCAHALAQHPDPHPDLDAAPVLDTALDAASEGPARCRAAPARGRPPSVRREATKA